MESKPRADQRGLGTVVVLLLVGATLWFRRSGEAACPVGNLAGHSEKGDPRFESSSSASSSSRPDEALVAPFPGNSGEALTTMEHSDWTKDLGKDVVTMLRELMQDRRAHRALLLSSFVFGLMIPLSPITAQIPNLDVHPFIKGTGMLLWSAGMVSMFFAYRRLQPDLQSGRETSFLLAILDILKCRLRNDSTLKDEIKGPVSGIDLVKSEIETVDTDVQNLNLARKMVLRAVVFFVLSVAFEYALFAFFGYRPAGR